MSTYIFIDGGYLSRAHLQSVEKWFGFEPSFHILGAIQKFAQLSNRPDSLEIQVIYSGGGETQAFYYDCLDEEKKNAETDHEFDYRLRTQDERLRELRDLNNCHIRLGTLKGSKRRRQKEVDVLMAVDMMAHAARNNMGKAVLVAGDLDFRPAVEALVQMGIVVHIIADQKVAKELTWAASSFSKLTFQDFFGWTDGEEQQQHPLPVRYQGMPDYDSFLIKQGLIGTRSCHLFSSSRGYLLHCPKFKHAADNPTFIHKDLDKLELYFELQHNRIVWQSPAAESGNS